MPGQGKAGIKVDVARGVLGKEIASRDNLDGDRIAGGLCFRACGKRDAECKYRKYTLHGLL